MGMVNSKPQTTLANAQPASNLRRFIANYTPQDGGFYEHGVGIKVKGDSDNLHLWLSPPPQVFHLPTPAP